jgi:hypothetical protein
MPFNEASFKTRESTFLIFPLRFPCAGYFTSMHVALKKPSSLLANPRIDEQVHLN